MIRVSPRGAYLLLALQGRALIRGRALYWETALISFLRNKRMEKQNCNIVIKEQ